MRVLKSGCGVFENGSLSKRYTMTAHQSSWCLHLYVIEFDTNIQHTKEFLKCLLTTKFFLCFCFEILTLTLKGFQEGFVYVERPLVYTGTKITETPTECPTPFTKNKTKTYITRPRSTSPSVQSSSCCARRSRFWSRISGVGMIGSWCWLVKRVTLESSLPLKSLIMLVESKISFTSARLQNFRSTSSRIYTVIDLWNVIWMLKVHYLTIWIKSGSDLGLEIFVISPMLKGCEISCLSTSTIMIIKTGW